MLVVGDGDRELPLGSQGELEEHNEEGFVAHPPTAPSRASVDWRGDQPFPWPVLDLLPLDHTVPSPDGQDQVAFSPYGPFWVRGGAPWPPPVPSLPGGIACVELYPHAIPGNHPGDKTADPTYGGVGVAQGIQGTVPPRLQIDRVDCAVVDPSWDHVPAGLGTEVYVGVGVVVDYDMEEVVAGEDTDGESDPVGLVGVGFPRMAWVAYSENFDLPVQSHVEGMGVDFGVAVVRVGLIGQAGPDR